MQIRSWTGLLSVMVSFGFAGALAFAQAPATPKAPAAAKAGAAKSGAAKAGTAKAGAAAAAPAAPAVVREPGVYATIALKQGNAPFGTVVLRLFEKESPITVKNFIDLATGAKAWTDPRTGQKVKKPLYNGLTFHRVIPDFMIQGGDPLGTGTGGTEDIPDEFHPTLKFDVPGRLAMANAGPGTGSCQFFITEKPTPWLDGRHTIFGQVIEGQDVVAKAARVPSGSAGRDKPNVPLVMTVSIKRFGAPAAPAARPAGAKSAVASKAAAKSAPKAAPAKAAETKK